MIGLANKQSLNIKQSGLQSIVLIALVATSFSVGATPVGISVGVGTLGPGASVTYSADPKLNVRLGVNRFDQDFDLEVDKIDYDGEVQLKTVTAMLDWHPWASGFRMSAGLVGNSNQITGTARPSNGSIEFNGKTIDLSEAGIVYAEMDFKPIVPYFGFGWGNAAKGGGLSFSSDLGVMFQGTAKVDINVQNLEAVGLDQSDVNAEIKSFKDEVDSYGGLYPVVSIGIAYNL